MSRCRRNKICPKCGNVLRKLSRHHILPQRYFHGRGRILKICRKCHTQIETMIRSCELRAGNGHEVCLREGDYYRIAAAFMKGERRVENVKRSREDLSLLQQAYGNAQRRYHDRRRDLYGRDVHRMLRTAEV
jgi:hypothetical protein